MKLGPVKFENPSNKSIHEVTITVKDEVRTRQVPALSKEWIEARSYTKYVPIAVKNGQLDQNFLLDEWICEVQWFNKDLQFILEMEYYQFWSHISFDPNFLDEILFYLQESTPFYLPIRTLTENELMIQLYDKVARNVLAIVCRLITNKESESEWMSKQSLADLLYKNFIISIPMLFDLISLYGQCNLSVLKKIFETLLKIENQYLGDLQLGTQFIRSTFSTIQNQLDNDEAEESLQKYEDLTLYFLNTIVTLNLLVEICPADFKIFCSTELKLEQSLASFYDNFVPALHKKICGFDSEAWFMIYLSYARVETINGFRNLLSRNVENILNGNVKNAMRAADNMLSVLTECAGFQIFLTDYRRAFPIEIDLDVIDQSCKNIDEIKLNFVRDAYTERSDAKVASRPSNGVYRPTIQEEINSDMDGAVGGVVEIEAVEPVDSEELIQTETGRIIELFPDYGVGYIRKLLAYYDNSSEKVISAILEGNLAPDLAGCDQKETYIPPEIPDEVYAATGLERTNIYDGDEFDVMRIKEFTGVVKIRGNTISKKEPRNLNDLLNDKTHIRAMQDRYQTFGMVNDLDDDENENLYDDEYDDSYDVYTENAPKIKLNTNMRNVLIDEIDEESSSEDEPEQPLYSSNATSNSNAFKPQHFQRGHNDFCENPEVIRARREQAYQSKQRRGGPPRPNKPSRDVVGVAKGQGQSSDVLHNRAHKNANKATRGNHSRKRGADFKASRGMF